MTAPLLITQRGPIRELHLNRPAQRNAINPSLIAALSHALDEAERDHKTRVIVLAGQGPSFCAGADLRHLSALASHQESPRAFLTSISQCFGRLEQLCKPVVAAVHGHVVAGGLEMALCCDIVIAQSGTLIGDGHVRNNLLPGGGGTLRLSKRVGAPLARWLMMSGALAPAELFLASGFLHSVVAPTEFEQVVRRVAEQMADVEPETMSRLKNLIRPPQGEWLATMESEMAAIEEHWRHPRLAQSLRDFIGRDSKDRTVRTA